MTKRSFGVLLALTLATAACRSGGSGSSASGGSDSAVGPTPAQAILGTWRSEYTCEKFVQGFQGAGIPDLAPTFLVAMGLQKGPVDRLDANSLCDGATEFERRHFFRPNGYLINYQNNKIVDDCRCYLLVDDHTFVSLGDPGTPDVTLDYTITGDTLTFSVVRPDPCSTQKCLESVAIAEAQYAVTSWTRVS